MTEGQFVQQFGARGTGPGQFTEMHDIAVGPTGNVYVADASRIQVFNAAGEFLRQWGAKASKAGGSPS